MTRKQLKNSILQWAIQGKLVPQDPNDEPASVLLDKIRQEKERLIKEKKIKRDKNASIIYRGEDNSYYEKMLATGEVKCIDEEIPFDVPQGWEWTRIGNIFNHASGKQQSSSNKGGGTSQKFITTSNLYWGYFVLDNVKVMNFTDEEIKTCSATKGDLLVCEGGAGYGRSAIWNEDYDICLQNHVHRLHPCVSGLCEYVYYFIYLLKESNNLASVGTAMPGLSANRLKGLLLPLPPLSEQRRIVAKLAELLPHIDKYGKVQNHLDELNTTIKESLKKSILQEAIQGKLVPQIASEGTAKDLLEQIKTEKQKLVKDGKLKKSALASSVIFRGDDNKYYEQIGKKCRDITEQIPFEIPSNWEWCRVRNVSNSHIGLTYKPTDIDEKGTIVLRSCNIRNGKLALDDIVRVSSSISEKMLIEENDIIICARNGSKRLIGKSALIKNLPEPMTFGAFMAICKTPIYEYMFAYLQSDLFFGQLRDVSNTTTINQLTQNKFNDFLIPIPPVREQERIAFKISQLFQELR